jgi:hypothetical protein
MSKKNSPVRKKAVDATMRLSISQVAVRIKRDYQHTRNLVMKHEFGVPTENERGRLTVLASAVAAWIAAQKSAAAEATA